jgi:xylan 1,4-beta-xylosidase
LLNAYEAMGRPAYPTPAQIEKLREAAQLPPPETKRLEQGEITVRLAPQGLSVVEVRR